MRILKKKVFPKFLTSCQCQPCLSISLRPTSSVGLFSRTLGDNRPRPTMSRKLHFVLLSRCPEYGRHADSHAINSFPIPSVKRVKAVLPRALDLLHPFLFLLPPSRSSALFQQLQMAQISTRLEVHALTTEEASMKKAPLDFPRASNSEV